MWIPDTPVTEGELATILLITEATIIAFVWRLNNVFNQEKAQAHQFRSQLIKQIQKAGQGSDPLAVGVNAMLAPIGDAIADRIRNPPPPKDKKKDVKPNGKEQGKQEEGTAAHSDGDAVDDQEGKDDQAVQG